MARRNPRFAADNLQPISHSLSCTKSSPTSNYPAARSPCFIHSQITKFCVTSRPSIKQRLISPLPQERPSVGHRIHFSSFLFSFPLPFHLLSPVAPSIAGPSVPTRTNQPTIKVEMWLQLMIGCYIREGEPPFQSRFPYYVALHPPIANASLSSYYY